MKTPTDDDAKRFVERAEALTRGARDLRVEFAEAYPLGAAVRHKVTGRTFTIVGPHPEFAFVQLSAPGERGGKVGQPYMLVTDIDFEVPNAGQTKPAG